MHKPRPIVQCSAITNESPSFVIIRSTMIQEKPCMKEFSRLQALGNPQKSLSASLPPTSSLESLHQPFPSNAPTFESASHPHFSSTCRVFQRDRYHAFPRKAPKDHYSTSDNQVFMFLGKLEDGLRKDARSSSIKGLQFYHKQTPEGKFRVSSSAST